MFIKANYIFYRGGKAWILEPSATIIMRTRWADWRKIFGVRSRKRNGELGALPSNNRYTVHGGCFVARLETRLSPFKNRWAEECRLARKGRRRAIPQIDLRCHGSLRSARHPLRRAHRANDHEADGCHHPDHGYLRVRGRTCGLTGASTASRSYLSV